MRRVLRVAGQLAERRLAPVARRQMGLVYRLLGRVLWMVEPGS
jgi:hypothetical protein